MGIYDEAARQLAKVLSDKLRQEKSSYTFRQGNV